MSRSLYPSLHQGDDEKEQASVGLKTSTPGVAVDGAGFQQLLIWKRDPRPWTIL